jgi:hypothetical protein
MNLLSAPFSRHHLNIFLIWLSYSEMQDFSGGAGGMGGEADDFG